MSEHLDKAFSPARLGKLELKNRIIKAATYEGKTPDGVPGDLLLDFHKAVVEGGTAMTTIGYCTTEADGRINDQMMWMREEIPSTEKRSDTSAMYRPVDIFSRPV